MAVNSTLTIRTNRGLNPNTVNSSTLLVTPTDPTDGTSSSCTAVTYDAELNTMTCTHGDLSPGLRYTVTVTTQVEDESGQTLEENKVWNFSTAESTSPNNPVAQLKVPSFGSGGEETVLLSFSAAMDAASFPEGAVRVFTPEDPDTNLCSGMSYDTETQVLTCTIPVLTCRDTPEKYQVTVNSEPRSAEGGHRVVPFSSYFSNIDDGFDKAGTVNDQECWDRDLGNDEGVTVEAEVVDSNIANPGFLTFSGVDGIDLTNSGDGTSRLRVTSPDMPNAFAVTVKIQSFTGFNRETEEPERLTAFAQRDGEDNNTYWVSLNPERDNGSTVLQAATAIDGGTWQLSDMVNVVEAPVSFCMARDANGTYQVPVYAEGEEPTSLVPLTGDLSFATVPGSTEFSFFYRHAADNATVLIDWVRFNIGEAVCPQVMDVE